MLGALCLATQVVCSCHHRQEGAAPEEQDVATMASDTDSVKDLQRSNASETMPPTSVDDIYDDFLYAYMTNRSFQLSRTVFPLPFSSADGDTVVERAQWEHHAFFADNGEYLTIFADKASRALAEDAGVGKVTVEHYMPHDSIVAQYFFVKEEGEWHLTRLTSINRKRHADCSFMDFFCRFSTDSVFQAAHVRNPFELFVMDPDTYEALSGLADASQWESLKPYLPENEFYNIDFSQPYAKKRHQRIVVLHDMSGGEGVVLWFNRRGSDDWELTRLEK